VPWAQPQAEAALSELQPVVAEVPWVLLPEEEAQLLAQPVAVAVPHAEVQAAAEAQHVAVLAAAQHAAVPVVVEEGRLLAARQVQPSEARAEQLSAEPSARSDRRARLARRRMTTAFRREPALARTERLQSQSSSAEGVECSS